MRISMPPALRPLILTHEHTQTQTSSLGTRSLCRLRSLSLSLSSFTSKVSPPRCCATRTIIIKTKMFKIHFLCFFTHRRISAVLVCHLSCASSLSTSFTHTHTHILMPSSTCKTAVSLTHAGRTTGPAQWRQNKQSCWTYL